MIIAPVSLWVQKLYSNTMLSILTCRRILAAAGDVEYVSVVSATVKFWVDRIVFGARVETSNTAVVMFGSGGRVAFGKISSLVKYSFVFS